MFKKQINGKTYFVKKDGEPILDADGNMVEVPAAVEATIPEVNTEEAAAIDSEVQAELEKYISNQTTKGLADGFKALNLSGKSAQAVQDALRDAFAPSDTKSSLDVEAIKKGFAQVKAEAGKSFEFSVKTLSELNSLTGEVILEDRQPEITRDPQRQPLIETLANVGTTSSNKVTWVEVLTETGAPATTAELATFPEKDWTFGVKSTDVLKVAAMTKHSTEILEDMPELVNAVRNMLTEDLNLKVDEKLYAGLGTGGDFKGIKTIATAFAAGALVVPDANKLDVLRAALTQIATAGKGSFQATAIVLNPIDAAELDLTKGSDGHYVMPPFTSAERTTVKGVRVIESTLVTAGEFLVGDFRRLNVRNARGLSVQVATENGTDFEKDMLTIRASRRLAIYVRTNDEGAFVKGTFAAAITDLAS